MSDFLRGALGNLAGKHILSFEVKPHSEVPPLLLINVEYISFTPLSDK